MESRRKRGSPRSVPRKEGGEVAQVQATPDSFHEKGRFTPPDSPKKGPGKAWAYPAVANGRLYIRDMGTIWCFDVKAVTVK
jgi:outer membrane protein assembly factor BamB